MVDVDIEQIKEIKHISRNRYKITLHSLNRLPLTIIYCDVSILIGYIENNSMPNQLINNLAEGYVCDELSSFMEQRIIDIIDSIL